MKKIAVYFDGTWNVPDQRSTNGRPCPTNIVKLYQATLATSPAKDIQVVQYIKGLGTRWSERITGGGFGYGISENIKEGYKFLVSNYQPGDEIYIFGFSRGAFSARSLVGLIRNVGILRREKFYLVDEAYKGYKSKARAWHPDGVKAIEFRSINTYGDEKIKFLGVFDTVGSLGAPFGIVMRWVINRLFGCSFHDTRLSSIVLNAAHCLAIDERRLPFMPTLMTPGANHNPKNFEQKWFPGVHSDIGGGYPETGLSDITLEWMAGKARKNGLGIDLGRVNNPPFCPSISQPIHDSLGLVYRIATVFFVKIPGVIKLVSKNYVKHLPNIKWSGAYIREISDKGDVQPYLGKPGSATGKRYNGSLDHSVIEKINLDKQKYNPPNVV